MSEVFEIHITGNKSIIEACKKFNVKTIEIDLLYPNKDYLRTEYMTSMVKKFDNLDTCMRYVFDLQADLVKEGVNIIRTKIESPYYEHYKDKSLYIESHFDTIDDVYPISQNRGKTNFLSTDREYDKNKYSEFIQNNYNNDIELCLLDTNIAEDSDWFVLYD